MFSTKTWGAKSIQECVGYLSITLLGLYKLLPTKLHVTTVFVLILLKYICNSQPVMPQTIDCNRFSVSEWTLPATCFGLKWVLHPYSWHILVPKATFMSWFTGLLMNPQSAGKREGFVLFQIITHPCTPSTHRIQLMWHGGQYTTNQASGANNTVNMH